MIPSDSVIALHQLGPGARRWRRRRMEWTGRNLN
jgi:hypothetical protein